MSTSPETEFDLELHFLPAWAKESPRVNRYEKFEGAPERTSDRRDRRDRPPRPGGARPGGPGRGGPGRGGPGGGGPGRGGPARPGRAPYRGGRDSGGPEQREGRENRAVAPIPLPEINLSFVPDDNGVDSLARQIRMTGRAYPLFEIAQMVLAKPERHSVTLAVKRNVDNSIIQPLFSCALDETLWLSEDDAIRHALDKHFAMFYQAERTQIDPPKGVYTFVAQCGMSGTVLGPPNYHDYQNQMRKLHAERFSRMPFDAFKSRVRIVKDEAVVKKWIEDQSWKTEYACLNVAEPLKLPNREEVEKHFRQVHVPVIIKPVESVRVTGTQSRNVRDRQLSRLVRQRWEEQKRFPLQVATVLSQQFAGRGLQFFKVNKTVTHVSVARPHYLDLETTPVSEGIKRIVDYINSHPKCTHRQLVEALARGSVPGPGKPRPESPPPAPTPEGAETAQSSSITPVEPSPEMTAVMTDLHWLIHQGHVIEFANGVLETAKKPVPRPPKPSKNAAPGAEQPSSDAVTPAEMVATEAPPPETAEPPSGAATDAPETFSEPMTSAAIDETAAATEQQQPSDSGQAPAQP